MIQEPDVIPVSGLLTFESLSGLRIYLKQLLVYYEKEFDLYSQKVGALMRLYEKQERGRDAKRFRAESWQKVGMLMVNTRDPLLGTLEIMLEAMEEYKVKLTRTREVLTEFDELEEVNIADGYILTLYLRNGVPMRLLVDNQKSAAKLELVATGMN